MTGPVTFDAAIAAHKLNAHFYTWAEFHHVTRTNADGTPLRVRRNGKTQTWKTRPGHFRIPVKYGLYGYGEITHENASEWRLGRGDD